MLRERKYSLDDVHTFALVAEHGSLSGAAEALGVPPSTVGRRVSRLEDDLGVALLTREHRRVGLTADGDALWRRCRGALRELDDATDLRMEAEGVRGTLRVTVGVGAPSRPGFGEMLGEFQRAWPGIQLELRVTNRVVDLVEEGVDVALRPYTPMTAIRDADLRLRRLGGTPFGLFATPDRADMTVDDLDGSLIGHPILRMAGPVSKQFSGWFSLVGCRTPTSTDDFDSVLALAAAGMGVGLAPQVAASNLLEQGRLVRVLPDLVLGGSEVCAMWPASRHLVPRVRAFVDHCVASAPQMGLDPVGRWVLDKL